MFSLIASAKRNNLNVYRHLSDVGRHPPATPTSQLHPFLPDRWQAPTPERSNLHASDASSPRPPAPRPCPAASAHTTGAVERLRGATHRSPRHGFPLKPGQSPVNPFVATQGNSLKQIDGGQPLRSETTNCLGSTKLAGAP
jgi:hypothetical protein